MMVLLTPSVLEVIENYSQLKESTKFNEALFKHYKHAYQRARRRWKFTTAAMLWFRMKHYQRRMEKCRMRDLINALNYN